MVDKFQTVINARDSGYWQASALRLNTWWAVKNVFFSGGTYRVGQIIGETDSKGYSVIQSPYPPQSVLAMVYRHLGIDPGMTFNDYTGRPRYVLEERQLIKELI